jgi:hypothetical protein
LANDRPAMSSGLSTIWTLSSDDLVHAYHEGKCWLLRKDWVLVGGASSNYDGVSLRPVPYAAGRGM